MEAILKEVQDEATESIAGVFHYLIYHERLAQLYHELRLGVQDDVGKFSVIISRALRELYRLKDDREKGAEVQKLRWPSQKDIEKVQRHHERYGAKYLQILLGIAAGACPKCFEEKGGG